MVVTGIGPALVLLSRCWSDVGTSHPWCKKCHWYSVLTHWMWYNISLQRCRLISWTRSSQVINVWGLGGWGWGWGWWWWCWVGGEGLRANVYLLICIGGRRGAVVAALSMHWSYCRPVSNHQYIHRSLRVVPVLGQRRYHCPDVGPVMGQLPLLLKTLWIFHINPLIRSV